TTGTESEADKIYEAVSGTAALQVSGSETFYSGTRLTLSGTAVNNAGRYGAYVYDQGRLDLYDVTSTGGTVSAGHAAYATGFSTMTITGGTFTSEVGGYGICYSSQATGWVENVSIMSRQWGSHAFVINFARQVDGQNLTVETFNNAVFGVYYVHSTGTISGLTMTTHGSSGHGIVLEGNSTLLEVKNFTVRTEGTGAHSSIVGSGYASAQGIGDNTLILRSGTLVTTGSNAIGAAIGGAGNNALFMHDVTIEVSGQNSVGIYTNQERNGHDKTNTIVMDGGSVYAENGPAVLIGTYSSTTANTDPDAVTSAGGTYDIALTGNAQLSGTSAFEINNRITGTLADGEPYTADTMNVANITVTDGVTITGDTNLKGSSTATLNLDHSTLTGNITGIEDTNLTLSGSHGTTITGTVSGNDHAIIDLTVSGTGSTLLGDITQSGSSAVTVILDNSATGQGGYNGGNLITGGDSVWTFNKNSHGNYGENNGTWNIGNYEVIFDNMTHTGTVNISVNTDTGEGGSITVDTADGDGTVHIDTTGNGKLNPNDVLPGKVTGKGTENWQWDPIDWGIDTIIKDGDHFIKQGTSPAGAVLNSSVAIQQAMWFAQQNSLLKRMGELRFNHANPVTVSGKDAKAVTTISADHLIENIWLRSYGQQLNIGSQVAGKAYEQLIYGVDLGTDHKFTISADSDLYLGVYAGYGRSDLDYRTPGADGELNSYYGGLYATWLHSSGFYIDATFKAASVNNDLKAPYGTTQLTANYSDVNLGGSIEIGNKFTFTDGWFIEPQFQVNYLHILAENYTAGPMTISAQDLDALQLRLGSLFGRTINLTNSGALQPYIKISGVETISSGGTLHNGYQHTRANTDGARAELGGGLIWQLDADNQLHLDYEASFGDKYDKPWGLTAGYRHQF
ncbi:MAG: autotransporter outer membrane beta-barrel domain-containing protein, partial [Verrucomicrobiales bacterium]|nr:autotransporter outer membrane beta-barrel domain-containing protein [Verrucomicrobiales bacterium]